MKVFCYTRADTEAEAKKVHADMRARFRRLDTECTALEPDPYTIELTDWDGMAGQRGLNSILNAAKGAAPCVMAVWLLSNLARDILGMIKHANELLDAGVSVYCMKSAIMLVPSEDRPEVGVIRAFGQAHLEYVASNRKTGIATARAAGATIGRPVTFTLDSARKTIERLTDTKTGELPSVRDLAKAIGSGHTRAHELLKEYAETQKASETT